MFAEVEFATGRKLPAGFAAPFSAHRRQNGRRAQSLHRRV